MIYLDNAATSFPKPGRVIEQVNECITHYCANPGRSGHKLALETADKIYECREALSKLLRFPRAENFCFTQNATHALNIAIKSVINDKCHVIISDLEHNSVIRPLRTVLKKYGGELSVYDTDIPPEESITPLIRSDTVAIISTLCSNVTGRCIDIKTLSSIAKRYSLKLILDASQYIGHKPLDLTGITFEALCAPGHKALFGLQGCGFVLFSSDNSRQTILEGGTGTNSFDDIMPAILPERFEAGTLPSPSIIGLNAGISFIEDYGIYNVEKRLQTLTEKTVEMLSCIKNIKIIGAENGIISFLFEGIPSANLERELDRMNIYVRSGIHCSPIIHKKLGTEKDGAVRVSYSVLNKDGDIDKLYLALSRIKA